MDTAMQAIVETALQQGLWAALYIYLFFRMLRESKDREEMCIRDSHYADVLRHTFLRA